MADNKKKYWLKLDKNFLKSSQMKVVKAMPNGRDYIIFYLSLMLESIETVGHLRFTSLVPYNSEMLAAVTDTNIDIVEKAVKIFCELGMMQIFDDGTIFLPQVPSITGKESESAERVRNYRQRLKENDEILALQCNGDVTNSNDNKEEDKKEDKEQDEQKKVPYEEIKNLYHEICVSYPKVIKLSDARKTTIKARYQEYKGDIDIFKTLFTKAEASNFLKGNNSNNWKANFDWLINPTNMLKVLEGNYDNKEGNNNAKPKINNGIDVSKYADER